MDNIIKSKIEALQQEKNKAESLLSRNMQEFDIKEMIGIGGNSVNNNRLNSKSTSIGNIFQNRRLNDMIQLGITMAMNDKKLHGYRVQPLFAILSKVVNFLR